MERLPSRTLVHLANVINLQSLSIMEVSIYGHSFIAQRSTKQASVLSFKVEYTLVKDVVIIKKVVKIHGCLLKDSCVKCLTGKLGFSCQGTPRQYYWKIHM